MNEKPEENIFAEERKQMIVELVNENAKTTVAELRKRFAVSPATIRNDLRELEQSGLLKRTHGGAMSNRRANFEPDAYEKEIARIEQKQAIARMAATHVSEGDTIAVDTGTTAFEFVKQLTDFEDLTIITNDLQIAMYIERNSKSRVIIAGGMMRRNFHCTTGQKAMNTICDLNADKTFIGANGVSIRRGITTPDIDTACLKRVLIDIGEEVILMADSTKLDKASFAKYAEVSNIDVLITDDEADEEYIHMMREAGAFVELCNVSIK